jgi:hypothetical protein
MIRSVGTDWVIQASRGVIRRKCSFDYTANDGRLFVYDLHAPVLGRPSIPIWRTTF